MQYRPEIDGLRAVSILAVVFFHAGFSLFSGGYIGVDVFFVISGYLITTLIQTEQESGRFCFRRFYLRRAARLLPALFFLLVCLMPVAFLFLAPSDAKRFFQSIASTATFASNLLFFLTGGYFDTAAEIKPLLHSWSLSVEEQFYLLYPLILAVVFRIRKRALLPVLVILLLTSLMLSIWQSTRNPLANFYLSHFRAWEILAGALCPFIMRSRAVRLNAVLQSGLAGTGFLMIMIPVFAYNALTPSHGPFNIIPVTGTLLVLVFANGTGPVSRILHLRGLCHIGLISYSLYLWHQPIFSFAHYLLPTPPNGTIMAALCGVALAISWLSWRYVETPFRTGATHKRVSLPAYVVASLLLAGLGLLGNTGPVYSLAGRANPDNIRIADYNFDNNGLIAAPVILRDITGDPTYGTADNRVDNTPWFDNSTGRKNVLVIGNSYAMDIFNVLWSSRGYSQHYQWARYGAQLRDLRADHPVFSAPNYQQADYVIIATRFDDGQQDAQNLAFIVGRILADHKKLAIIRATPEFPVFNHGRWTIADQIVRENAMAFDHGTIGTRDIALLSDRAHFMALAQTPPRPAVLIANETIDRLHDEHREITILDRMDFMCNPPQETCPSMDPQLQKYYSDYGHYTLAGTRYFATAMENTRWLATFLP